MKNLVNPVQASPFPHDPSYTTLCLRASVVQMQPSIPGADDTGHDITGKLFPDDLPDSDTITL